MARLLVTAFEPFAGRADNNSRRVAGRLLEELSDLSVDDLELPTVFDEAASRVIEHVTSEPQPYDLVVSLGEAAGVTQLETVARNLSHAGLPDNAGRQPDAEPIIEGSDAALPLSLPVHLVFAGIPDRLLSHFTVSGSAGTFVCNNTAYHLARHFQHTSTMYGFVHVPRCDWPDALDPGAIAELLATGLRRVLAVRDSEPVEPLLPHPRGAGRFPTCREEAEALLAAAGHDSPHRRFIEALQAFYEPDPDTGRNALH